MLAIVSGRSWSQVQHLESISDYSSWGACIFYTGPGLLGVPRGYGFPETSESGWLPSLEPQASSPAWSAAKMPLPTTAAL